MSVPELIHIWHRCHACGAQPIVGQRFDCQTCPVGPDNHLCEACYGLFERGSVTHPLPDSLGANQGKIRHVFRAVMGRPYNEYQAWLDIPRNKTQAPLVPDHFVVRPEFRSKSESFFGGHAFVVEAEDSDRFLLITALHVMDELIKSKDIHCLPGDDTYTGKELPPLVTGVTFYDVFAAKWMFAELGAASSMLVLPNARVGDEEPYSQRDIAAFQIKPGSMISAARLAAKPPQSGEPIWLAASTGQGGTARTFEAVVVEQTDRTLIFRFSAPPNVRYSSGAPLLNGKGEVVGINVGYGILDGHHVGHANHVTSIRNHLGWASR